jgi:hypothetical protein
MKIAEPPITMPFSQWVAGLIGAINFHEVLSRPALFLRLGCA